MSLSKLKITPGLAEKGLIVISSHVSLDLKNENNHVMKIDIN